MGRAGWNESRNYAIFDAAGGLRGYSYATRHAASGHAAIVARNDGAPTRVIVYPAAMNIQRVVSRSPTSPAALDQMGRLIGR